MVTMRYIAAALIVTLASACHSKNDAPPPYGAFATQAEAKLQADRQNDARADVIAKDKALGVRDEYLPCGTFKPAKEVNGYWYAHEDTAGCPPTAGQPDMHIGPGGTGTSSVSGPGDKSGKGGKTP